MKINIGDLCKPVEEMTPHEKHLTKIVCDTLRRNEMSNENVWKGGKDDANKEPFHKLDERVVRELYRITTDCAWAKTFQDIYIYEKPDISEGQLAVSYGLAQKMKAVLDVLKFGAEKYKWDSWKQVDNAMQRYMGAFLRHCQHNLNELDEESGLPHGWHALCNLYFLTYFELKEMEEPCNSKL